MGAFGTFSVIAVTIGFGLALAALAGAFSQAKTIAAALEGMARQPESAGQIQTAMIIGLAFIESLVIYVLVIAFILNGHLGTWADVSKTVIGGAAEAAVGG